MTILATVDCGHFQIHSFWDILELDLAKYLVFSELKDGSFVGIPLDEGHIREIGALEGADKSYVGPLKFSNAKHLKSN